MDKEKEILTRALGRSLAKFNGLSSVSLPASFPPGKLTSIAEEANAARGVDNFAHVVRLTPGEGEISSEMAIRMRSRDDGEEVAALLVHHRGELKQLKSLEAYNPLNPESIPAGVADVFGSSLSIREILAQIPRLFEEVGIYLSYGDSLISTLENVCIYMADAYLESGNDELNWTDAWWHHLDLGLNHLPSALRAMKKADSPMAEAAGCYVAFGLPIPDNMSANRYSKPNDARKYARLIAEKWDRTETVELAILDIRDEERRSGRLRPSEDHALSILPWNNLATVSSTLGHRILAVCFLGAPKEDWMQAWSTTQESSFFYNAPDLEEDLPVSRLAGSRSIALPVVPNLKNRVHIATLDPAAPVSGKQAKLGRFKVSLGSSKSFDPREVEIGVECRSSMVSVSNLVVEETESEIVAVFDIELTLTRGNWPQKPQQIHLSPMSDVATEILRGPKSIELLLPFPGRTSPILLEKQRAKTPSYKICLHSPTRYSVIDERVVPIAPDDASPPVFTLGKSTTHARVLTMQSLGETAIEWPDSTISLVAEALENDELELGLTKDFRVKPEGVLHLENLLAEIRMPDQKMAHVSPFTACAMGEPLSEEIDSSLESEFRRDPRSSIEDWLSDSCIIQKPLATFKATLGIVSVQIGDTQPPQQPQLDRHLGYYCWNQNAGSIRLVLDRAARDAVEQFWESFNELHLPDLSSDTGGLGAWPSRLDLRGLRLDRLQEYLVAFSELLRHSKANEPSGLLSFPFSVLATDRAGRLEGILLSPLHPLRMGWSWSVQNSANDLLENLGPEDVIDLLRFCDGLGFPHLAPSPFEMSYLLAMPLDTGKDGLFSGWSFLASNSVTKDGTGRLGSLLGRRFPVGAASGLDRGGVAAALRDYLRVHPLVSQINAGIYSSSEVQRSRELDFALVDAAAAEVARRGDRLPGGIRVFDSPYRSGPIPEPEYVFAAIEKAAGPMRKEKGSNTAPPPFQWKLQERPRVDIRFLETPLVEPSIAAGQSKELGGSAPDLPVNRHVTWSRAAPGTLRSAYCPGLPEDAFKAMPGYGRCLSLVEVPTGSIGYPEVSCGLLASELRNSPAQWTVAGNAHMDPATLSKEIGSLGSDLVLWEWRPAFLARTAKGAGSNVAPARPYTTIARLDPHFRDQLENDCVASFGRLETSGAELVLGELGSRGIGLSSLLSIGHTQTVGAIGFFLSFRALSAWEAGGPTDEIRCLLPMDAVNSVLEAIAKDGTVKKDRRRADILAVRAVPTKAGLYDIILHPVEVKMRQQEGTFPSPHDLDVKEALGQLENSSKLLASLCKNVNTRPTILLLNAVTSLMEAALALRADGNSTASEQTLVNERDFLQAISGGRARFFASAGTLFWFQSGGVTQPGSPIETRGTELDAPWQILLNPLQLGRAIISGDRTDVQQTFVETIGRDQIEIEFQYQAGNDGLSLGALHPDNDKNDAAKQKTEDKQHETKNDATPAETEEKSLEEPGNMEVCEETESVDTTGKIGKLAGVAIEVGERPKGIHTEKVIFDPSDTRVNQLNIGVVGDLGTGKTQFVRSLVYQLSRSATGNGGVPPKTLIFDYKNDFIDAEFIKNINGKLLSPGEEPIPLNFFALPEGASKNAHIRRAMFFADVVSKVHRIGPVQRNTLEGCVIDAYNRFSGRGFPLIADVLEIYSDVVPKGDSVTAVLRALVNLEIFEPNRQKISNFGELFDRSLVLDLKGINAGSQIQDILVTLFLDLVYNEYMPSRNRPDFQTDETGIQRRFIDSFVLVDEAHHIMEHGFDVLENLLLEGRQFGMGVILSSQYLSHFKLGGVNWAQPLRTWCIHKVPDISAQDLTRLGFGDGAAEMAARVPVLENLHSLFKCDPDHVQGAFIRDKSYFSFFE
ncbi:Type IV secretory pathway, VirB4 components [Roseibium album]|uniref:Type IV secretory pathway, VirB4 components n=2 Tax=Roseibium album TaxID=311410 RepID=A0A0M6ZN54_9HYPH|nr:Type IV secretory pathway, VirB4 components [Roseibium album]CTQ63661.1 Type IV secretory pathway, VirB4 components [Roseibium album]CTQ72189.1 Type IV secretory pathway, VirB4 components [Roseibium album]